MISQRIAEAYDRIANDLARINAAMPDTLVDYGHRFLSLTGLDARVLDVANYPGSRLRGMSDSVGTVVRFASLADFDVVSRYNYLASVGGVDVVRRMIERQQVVVAEQGGRPLGYAYFDYLGVLDPFLAMIWVFEEYREQGAGKAILRFLEEYFRVQGHDVLYSSSRVDEPRPQAWHRHLGFEECGFIVGSGQDSVGEVYFRKRLR